MAGILGILKTLKPAASYAQDMAEYGLGVDGGEAPAPEETAEIQLKAPDEWRTALHEVFQSLPAAQQDALADVEQRAFDCVEDLHAKVKKEYDSELRKARSKLQWKLAAFEQKMQSQRSASKTESSHQAAVLEGQHREAVTRLQDEMKATATAYEEKLAEAVDQEEYLQRRINLLDEGMTEAQKARQAAIQRMQQMAARRIKNGALSRGWNAWIDVWWSHMQKIKAATRLLNTELTRGFGTWYDYVEEAQRQKRLLKHAAARLLRPALAASIGHWRRDWELATRTAMADEHSGQLAELEEQLAAAHAAVEAKEAALANGRLEEAKLQQLLTDGVSAAEKRAAEERAKHLDMLHQMAARRLLNQKLASGWDQWVLVWAAVTRAKRMLARAGGRLQNRKVSLAWNGWVETWVETSRNNRLLAAAAARLKNPMLTSCVAHWRSDWEASVACREHQAAVEQERLRMRTQAAAEREASLASAVGRVAELQTLVQGAEEARARAETELAERIAASTSESAALRAEAAECRAEADSVRLQMAEMMGRLRDELETVRRDYGRQVVACGEQILELKQLLADSRGERDNALAALAATEAKLLEHVTPLSAKQKAQIVAMMHARMEELSRSVAQSHETRIRELTQLIALRDRQLLSRSSSSPRLLQSGSRESGGGGSYSPTAAGGGTASGVGGGGGGGGGQRSLDARPVMSHQQYVRQSKQAQRQPRPSTGAPGTRAGRSFAEAMGAQGKIGGGGGGGGHGSRGPLPRPSSAAGLLVTPTFPEAAAYAQQVASQDATVRIELLRTGMGREAKAPNPMVSDELTARARVVTACGAAGGATPPGVPAVSVPPVPAAGLPAAGATVGATGPLRATSASMTWQSPYRQRCGSPVLTATRGDFVYPTAPSVPLPDRPGTR